jgi:hypothetical protein
MQMFSAFSDGEVAQKAYADAYAACSQGSGPQSKVAQGETEEQKKKRLEAEKKKKEEEAKKAAEEKKRAEEQAKQEADEKKKAEIEAKIKELDKQLADLKKQIDVLQQAADDISNGMVKGAAAAGGAAGTLNPKGVAAAVIGTSLYVIYRGMKAFGDAGLYYKPPPKECMVDDAACGASCEARARAAAWKALFMNRRRHDNCADRVMPNPEGSFSCPMGSPTAGIDGRQLLKERCDFVRRFYSTDAPSCETADAGAVLNFESRFEASVCSDPRAMCTAEQGSSGASPVVGRIGGGQPVPFLLPGGKLK